MYLHYRKLQTNWGLFSKSGLLNIYHCPRASNGKGAHGRPVKESIRQLQRSRTGPEGHSTLTPRPEGRPGESVCRRGPCP